MSSKTLRRIATMVLTMLALTCNSLSVWARSTSPIPSAALSTVISTVRSTPGTTIYTTLTGSTSGSVWGSIIYTMDSDLATAAVHAGVLAAGETKTVKLTVLPGQTAYDGSARNGVTSSSYGPYAQAYRLDADDGGDNPILSDPGSLRLFESNAGGVYRFKVTGSARAGGTWGTNAYTSDSNLSVAAVHAGVLRDGQIGVVRAVIVPAQSNYVGSAANGVTSSSYGQYAGAYAVSNDSGGVALTAYPGMLPNPLPNPGSLGTYRGRNSASLNFNVTGSTSGGIWGTGTYTDDSSLAVAAVHAGLLAAGQQGVVKVTILPGLTGSPTLPTVYLGSLAHGITSNSYTSFSGSFSVSSPDGDLGAIPRVTNATSIDVGLSSTVQFQMTASPAATSYNATGLPMGLSVDLLTGVISGTPQVSGNFPVQLVVTNSKGASNATLMIKVAANPTTTAVPNSLTLIGPSALQSAGRASIAATANFSDASMRSVTPLWSSSNPLAAVVSTTGVLSAGAVTVDTPVTLTASYTDNGVTVQASLQVTITAAPAVLSGLKLVGATSVQSGGNLRLTVNALYADGSTRPVTASVYTLSSTALGSVNSRGVLTVATVVADTVLTVTASYTEGGVTKTSSLAVGIVAAPAVLSRLTLIGARGTLASGQTLSLAAEGVYVDGSRKAINAAWQVAGDAATISSVGLFTAKTVSQDTPSVVTATYTESGVMVSAQFQVLILAADVATPVQAEVEATGSQSDFGLSVWSRLSASGATVSPAWVNPTRAVDHIATTAQTSYKLYVVAIIPGGGIVPVTAFFMLNRNSEWQAAGFPLAEYLSGVADNSFQLVEIFDHLDASIISGTKIYIGYGLTDTEMLASGRFRLVYQMQ